MRISVITHVVVCVFLSNLHAQSTWIVEDSVDISDAIPPLTFINASPASRTLDSVRLVNPDSLASPYDTMSIFLSGESATYIYGLTSAPASGSTRFSVPPNDTLQASVWTSVAPRTGVVRVLCTFHFAGTVDTLLILLYPGLSVSQSNPAQLRSTATRILEPYSLGGRRVLGTPKAPLVVLEGGSSTPVLRTNAVSGQAEPQASK